MTVALPATAPASFEIKSAQLPLVALLLKSADLQLLARELTHRFGDVPDFFDHDPLLIDLSALPMQDGSAQSEVPDFAALLDLLRSFRLAPVGFRGGSGDLAAAALQAGLVRAADARFVSPAAAHAGTASEAPAPPPAPSVAPPPATALVIDKPLRSGQQVYARGRDLVVLAMVNAGAEVIADGNIHVYAPLRGKAMAGARGNGDARIFSLALDPELVSIAGIYRTSETPLPARIKGKPAQVRLISSAEGDKLVLDALD